MNRTVSGCAIMVLVEGLTEFAAASYATDPLLLAELRASWPPAPGPSAERDGYRPTDLALVEAVGAIRLTDRLAVVLATDAEAADDESFLVLPVVRDAEVWRPATSGDGLSAFVAGVPAASERPIDVDQTNASVVVGERVIVKWFRRVGPEPSRASLLLAHLAAVGFDGIPAPLGSLGWRSPAGAELTLAQGDAYLPGARDGWEWCVEAVESGADATLGARLGRLTAKLHVALGTPSTVIPNPVDAVGRTMLGRWRAAALAVLETAVGLTDGDAGEELRRYEPAMRRAIESLPPDGSVAVQPAHGDYHVGQVLAWSGGLAVIDFDGNPALGPEANALRQPVERDIAQMLASLDHVGRVVQERVTGDRAVAIDGWIADARSQFLGAVGPVDERLLGAFEVEQECRELVYAARFLPRWRYAPMATLRARYRR
jgi:maltokinase